jgi:hypothetical protein
VPKWRHQNENESRSEATTSWVVLEQPAAVLRCNLKHSGNKTLVLELPLKEAF